MALISLVDGSGYGGMSSRETDFPDDFVFLSPRPEGPGMIVEG
jgi:hypothetical protein